MDSGIVIGHRWVGGIGSKACDACREMIGKEFYINPSPGQLRYPDDIPVKPPIHPNCRCKLEPITDYLAIVKENVRSAKPLSERNPYLKDGYNVLGGVWGNDGRSITDGPANWNYCGKNWTAGRNPKNVKYGQRIAPYPHPDNDMDALCMNHDAGYEWAEKSKNRKRAKNYYDKKLLKELIDLPKEPRKWENPPIDVEAAENLRRLTVNYFMDKNAYYEKEKRYGERLMAVLYPILYTLYHEE